MNHASLETMMTIFGPHASAIEDREDDFSLRFPIGGPGPEVADVDGAGIYLWKSPERHALLLRGEDHPDGVSPLEDACEFEEMGWTTSREWMDRLAKMIRGTLHHSGGNCWHAFKTMPDGRIVAFCEDGIVGYPSADAWGDPDFDHDSAPWIDYADLAKGPETVRGGSS